MLTWGLIYTSSKQSDVDLSKPIGTAILYYHTRVDVRNLVCG